MTDVVVFCGGRGATTILSSLARTRNVQLTVVVNMYDAGLSTGRVRRAFSGMLGPSDIRKTVGTLTATVGDEAQRALASLLESRLNPLGGEVDSVAGSSREQLAALIDGRLDGVDAHAAQLVRNLSLETWFQLRDSLTAFQKALASNGAEFSYDDLAIGNAVFAGFFADGDLNHAVDRYQQLFGIAGRRVLNVSRGEDRWLSARAGDFICPDEGTLVSQTPPQPISDLYLLPRQGHDELLGGLDGWSQAEGVGAGLALAERLPLLNPEVARRVGEADVIVYGPGTQHSSLFPTYLTVGLGEEIAANRSAEKLFVANIQRDHDQDPGETVTDTLVKFGYFMTRRDAIPLGQHDLITSVLVNAQEAELLSGIADPIRVRKAVWAGPGGRHSGSAVKEEIASVVRLRGGEHLPGDSGLVSVVVPVLDERPRIGRVLQQLRYLDLSGMGLVHEIIVVDGGSSDGTLDLLRSEPDIRVVEAACAGRGDAVRRGLQDARGEYVVVFPSDDEYDVSIVRTVVAELRKDPEAAVLASRTLGGSSASHRLRAVYGDNRLLYILSHWGGVVVTLLLMAKLDRVVSDPLSGVRGACREVFRTLDNPGSGLDYEVMWVRRAVEQRHHVIEVPVEYHPRNWRDGKKTTMWEGARALLSVFIKRRKS